jgi:uncharacterized protein YecT (DUF1311 family)
MVDRRSGEKTMGRSSSRLSLNASLVVLMLAAGLAAPPARADAENDRCIDESDGSNAAWGACGSEYVARADKVLNATWKRVYGAAEGRTKQDLLTAQRAWIAFKETACEFYANGDWGREGEVLQFPACLAAVIETRTAELEGYGEFFERE